MTGSVENYSEIVDLYLQAFPENERTPLDMLLSDGEDGKDLLAFYNDNTFCGFAQLLTNWDLTHILYFAILEPLRGQGFGGKCLQTICQFKHGNRVIADIERPDVAAENIDQRQQRKQFYLRNGFKETQVRYNWHGEAYEILSAGGDVTTEEFHAFWKAFHRRHPESK